MINHQPLAFIIMLYSLLLVGNIAPTIAQPPSAANAAPTPTPPPPPAPNNAANRISYLGGPGAQQLTEIHRLSDGSYLLSGNATNIDFIPQGTPRTELPAADIRSSRSNRFGLILHVSADLQKVLHALYLPRGVVTDIRRIRSNTAPGSKTGDLYISGPRSNGDPALDGGAEGYFIAKLNGNFIDRVPTGFVWVHNVAASSDHQHFQPWDVDTQGRVYFAAGEPFNKTWSAIYRLKSDGQYDTVEHWRLHLTAEGSWHGSPASSRNDIQYSSISLKALGRGSLRSWTMEEFVKLTPDGNGGLRQGTWPWDVFFGTPYDDKAPGASSRGPGYTGYSVGPNDTGLVGGLVVDRRNDHVYMGLSLQSRLPNGKLDAEPAVVAFTSDGKMKWWSRLYTENNQNSPSHQYVDGLAIDYAKPVEQATLVVAARTYTNNPNNLWRGDQVKATGAPKRSFQSGWTGSGDQFFLGWLGRLSLTDGTLRNATYVGEYAEGVQFGGPENAYADPKLDGWPDHDRLQGDLANTRLRPALKVDDQGRVYILAVGRRVMTTANAWQKMPKPADGVSAWSEFVRVYSPDLTTLVYSSLLTGRWNTTTGIGGNNTALFAQQPTARGVVVVGAHTVDAEGIVEGNPIPVRNVVPWGRPEPAGEEAILAELNF